MRGTGQDTELRGPREWLRRVVVGSALVVLMWLIAPGQVQPDTKLDLVVSPWRYLGRGLDAWNAHSGIGELQNQAYGYLFPMGPVFGIAHSAGLPPWAAQRLWWSILVLVAFVGADRLLRRLGVERSGAALVGAVAFALSPRVLTVLSEISAEAWPLALCPWLVLAARPLLDPAAGTWDRLRSATGTGLLVAALGGINATASAAVLLAPACYLLTAAAGRRRALAWWLPGVVLGAAWWVLPLLVLGRYAYPFLDFIESAAITTAVTSVPNTLRGASHWVAWILTSGDHPTWQSGWVLAQSVAAIVATSALAGVGAAGLLVRRGPDHSRRFGIVLVLVGTLLMVAGHAGAVGSPVAEEVRALLDGPLAPLRNVHKLDPLVRLGLVLGLGLLLGTPRRDSDRPRYAVAQSTARPLVPAWTLPGVVALLLIGSTLPVWQGRVGDAWAYEEIPQTWRSMAEAVDARAEREGGATLLLPASRFGDYAWGRPGDEPLTALAESQVVVRGSAPLGPPAATRLLDRIDLVASSGVRQEGLAPALARMGVGRVVVRHDLAESVGAEPARLVSRTLTRSPGFERVEAVGGDGGLLELWRVEGHETGAEVLPVEGRIHVTGGPAATVGLASAGLLAEGELLLVGEDRLAEDGHGDPTEVLTDTLRWRALNPGLPAAQAYGPTTTADDPAPSRRGTRDLPPAGDPSRQPTREWIGAQSVRAGSSAADPYAVQRLGPSWGPAAAVDGDLATAWVQGDPEEGGPHLEVVFDRPRTVGSVSVTVAEGLGRTRVDEVTVHAGGHHVTAPVTKSGTAVADLGEVSASRVRVVLSPSEGTVGDLSMGIAELVIEDLPVGSVLALPAWTPTRDSAILLSRDARERAADGRRGEDGADLRRRLDLGAPMDAHLSATLRPAPGEALDHLLDAPLDIAGSSRADLAPRHRPGAALDGAPGTRWHPAPTDPRPTLTVAFGSPTEITGVHLDGAGAEATLVTVTAGGETRHLQPGGGDFPSLTTDRLTLVLGHPPAEAWVAPEVTLVGVPPPARGPVELACGEAGVVTVDAVAADGKDRVARVRLAATVPRDTALNGGPITARMCGGGTIRLPAGRVDVTAAGGSGVQTDRLVLASLSDEPDGATPDRVLDPGPATGEERRITVRDGAAGVLALATAYNEGWAATVGDTTLNPVRVDGWRQGFLLPPDVAGEVVVEFEPGDLHDAGLVAGALAVLMLLVGFVVSVRAGRRRHRTVDLVHDGGGATRHVWPAAIVRGVLLVTAVGALCAGPVGAGVGLASAFVPGRWRPVVAAGAMMAAGLAMAALGVVELRSAGAVSGQVLGTVTVCVLAAAILLPSGARPR